MITLVKFEQLAQLLKLDKAETEYPALTLLQESTVYSFENYLKRKLTFEKYKEVFQVDSTNTYALAALPVKSVISIVQDGVTLDPDTYRIQPYGVLIKYPSGSEEDLTITYKGGLEVVPGDISRAALLQVAYEWQNKSNIGAVSVSTEGGTTNTPELGLLKEVKRLLNDYRHPLKGIM